MTQVTPEPDVAGKVAVITGGGAGIGREFADALATRGARIAILDIDLDAATKAADALHTTHDVETLAVHCDVGDEPSCQRAVGEVASAFGRIDILVNNAAKHLMAWGVPVLQLDDARWRSLVDVNIHGIVNVTRHAAPWLRRRGGVIVNLSSIASIDSNTAYGVTKLAVRGLTAALAAELAADGVRVYAILPGAMDTEAARADLPAALLEDFINNKQLVKRQGTPADLVGAFLFFCSDAAGFITGESLVIGGGYPLRP
jgi:3-oxoacyl-[acyl-carrier protein] reductase